MLKYAALLFNTIALLICQFFFVEEVKITQNVPASATPDSEFIIEVTINKGSMGGFAKLQQAMPTGFSVTPIEVRGGDFKFVDQQMKIIWMSLPSSPEFKISYKVKVDSGVEGDKVIGGKFSYVVDNTKQEVEILESTISIKATGTEQPIATETNTPATPEVKTTETDDINKTEPIAATATAETKTETTTTVPETRTTTTTQEASSVTSVRKVPERFVYSKTNTTNDFVVEVKINKGNISGFAKLLETLPVGYSATAIESAGGTFTFIDQKVKYVWVSIPTETEFQISYKVTVADGISAGNINIEGVFSYIENDETKKSIVATSTISIEAGSTDAVAATTEANATETTPAATTAETKATSETVATNTSTTESTSITTSEASLSSTPTPQGNVNYRVQIAALKKSTPTAEALANRYHISEAVITEMADGFTKYTVGAHNEYKSARDAREEIRNKGVVGPFVTAYNSGKRITVQEALMITSQKWYK
jgi:6-phosphogluconate dehydrogenase (decarboxylating)